MNTYNDMTAEDCATLEALIDKYNLSRVVGTIACIAADKADHIASNWQDKELSRLWSRFSRVLDKVAARIARIDAGRE